MSKKISMDPEALRKLLIRELKRTCQANSDLMEKNLDLIEITRVMTNRSAALFSDMTNEDLKFWNDWINLLAEKENGTKS